MPKKTAGDANYKSVIDSLVNRYGVSDEPLVIALPHGDSLSFQVPSSLGGLKTVLKEAVNWYQSLPEKQTDKHPLSPYLPETQEVAIDAYLIHRFSIDEPKIGLKDACRLVAKCPWLTFSIAKAIKEHWREMESIWIAEMANSSKKNLNTTNGDEQSSEHQFDASENIQTG